MVKLLCKIVGCKLVNPLPNNLFFAGRYLLTQDTCVRCGKEYRDWVHESAFEMTTASTHTENVSMNHAKEDMTAFANALPHSKMENKDNA